MSKPTLLIHTVYFAEDTRTDAERLGNLLYNRLTRSLEDKLAFGPAIPVRVATLASAVNLLTATAEHLVLIPVLGQNTAQDQAARTSVIEQLLVWWQNPVLRAGGALLPVFTDPVWRTYEPDLPGVPLLQHVHGDESEGFERTLLQLVISVCQLLRDETKRLHVFISHAKTDLKPTKEAAKAISDFTKTGSTAQAFYDATDLQPGAELDKQLAAAAGEGVFVAVHSDMYSSRSWCQQEMLCAKRASVPTLSVEVLRSGEARSYPYAGNGPTIVWKEGLEQEDNALLVVTRAMVEWLRARHFILEAQRLSKGLPALSILPRSPELLDLVQGPLFESASAVVLHPDPELSYAERAVLRAARPRITLITPSTLYRGVESGQPGPVSASLAALSKRQIAVSVSEVIDAALIDEGMRSQHVDDAFVYLTRTLIGAGAYLAYGGDFRIGGYDELLFELIRTYKSSSVATTEFVHSFLPATFTGKVPPNIAVNIRRLGKGPGELAPPSGDISPARAALYISDLRRVMAESCFARVIIGGQTLPKEKAGDPLGYGGAYPGVVEEAWWTLAKLDKPLYIIGGFGGAAGLVAALANPGAVPRLLTEQAFADPQFERFQGIATEFAKDPEREKLGAPADMAALAGSLSSALARRLATDDASKSWNGLTVAENRELFQTRDGVRITELVMQGLFNVIAAKCERQLKIELVRGNIVRARGTSAIALPTFQDVPITGAGAALDQVLNKGVSTAKDQQLPLSEVNSQQVDAKWLIIADLGVFNDLEPKDIPGAIQKAATEVARLAVRHQFPRVSLVTFAGTTLAKGGIEENAARMLAGFESLAAGTTLEWFETDKARFEKLHAFLLQRGDVALTVREEEELAPAPAPPPPSDVLAFVRLADDNLRTTLLLPSGAAVVEERNVKLSAADIEALTRPTKPPSLAELDTLGAQLGDLLFGPGAASLDNYLDKRLVVLHDLESSKLPFEALRINGRALGLEGGVVRRPSMTGLALSSPNKLPRPSGKLKLLLIVNPTLDLPSAELEADAIKRVLGDRVLEIDELRGAAATREAVLQALTDPSYDGVQFSGHAFYTDGQGDGSGLLCAGRVKLTLADLQDRRIGPRFVFFNACQSARVRSDAPVVARALAEYVLRCGVEAYLGTFWVVKDAAAADFAVSVYRELAAGKRLDEAVLAARKVLLTTQSADWANYALYGSGAFQLKPR